MIINNNNNNTMTKLNEFYELCNGTDDENISRYIIVAFTDEYYVNRWSADIFMDEIKNKIENNKEKILEIRVFDEKREILMMRTDIGKDFGEISIIEDDDRDYFDEVQFLDIDEKKTLQLRSNGDYKVSAMGGGIYSLPLENYKNMGVVVRYYFGKYEESGVATISHCRIVGFRRRDEDGENEAC